MAFFSATPSPATARHRCTGVGFTSRAAALVVALGCTLLCPRAYAITMQNALTDNSWIIGLIAALILLQTLLILVLQRSRLNNKRARKRLKETQKALQQRIDERTESLYKINNLLVDEVARHEASGYLLRETKEYLQSIINSMPSIIIGVDAEGYITHWNAAADSCLEIFSNEALGKHVSYVLPQFPVSRDSIDAIIRAGEPRSLEHLRTHKDDSVQYFDITIYPLIANSSPGAVIRIDDVTLRITMENLMIQHEKMYSLGEVAAGIAHEINNPLSAILQNVQNINRRLDPAFAANQQQAQTIPVDLDQLARYLDARDIPQMLESIRAAGEHSASIVTHMLAFSHQGQGSHQWVNIEQLIHQTLALSLDPTSIGNHKPQIHTQLEDNLPPLKGSASELQQVLLNLLRNARQALAQQVLPKGEIHIRAFRQPLEPSVKTPQAPLLTIEVQDNGPGMSEHVRRHIFEPFFTTKAQGTGTGLGLSVSYFIITERHRGSIEVKSSPEKGTCFTIKLPLAPTANTP